MTLEEMLNMDLHEESDLNDVIQILRVPGGWNYIFWPDQTVQFVPEPSSSYTISIKED